MTPKTVLVRRACTLATVTALGLSTPAGAAVASTPATSATTSSDVATATATEPALDVPRPRGPRAVGAHELHLVDRDRVDPWNPAAGARQVGATVYYPATRPSPRPLDYLSGPESAAFLDFQQQTDPTLEDLPRDLLARVGTHATVDADPSGGRHPLVLLSPGFSLPAATLTGLATDLASRGYVVAALDHPYESSGTTLADGTLATCLACDTDDYAMVPRVRRDDVALVLDRLLAAGSRWRSLVDPHRIGMAGHSIGGNSAAVADRRVRAAADLDGTFFEPARDQDRPLLMLGTDSNHRPGGSDESWDRTWRSQRGPGAWVTLRGSNHGTFTDVPALAGRLGLPPREGEIDGGRGLQVTRAVVGAFFDRFLRGRGAGLPRFPELHRARGGF